MIGRLYKPNTCLSNFLFIPPPKKEKNWPWRICRHRCIGIDALPAWVIRWETVNVWRLSTQDQQVRMHYWVLIIIFTVDNFVIGLTLTPVEARPNRKAENGSGVIGKGAASQWVPSMRSWRAMQAPPVGSGARPWKLGFLSIFGRQKSRQNSLSDR